MFEWRRSGFAATHKPAKSRRWKTYSAESGYVFEYIFAAEPQPGNYQFNVCWDRKNVHCVSVELDAAAIASSAGRELTTVERFAVSKLALRQAFDDCAEPASVAAAAVRPTREQLAQILATLDLL